MRDKCATPGLVIRQIAARQHGVVAVAQLLEVGLTRAAVSRWVTTGRLHRVRRGVYTPGTPHLTREGYFMAAVLAVPGCVLSHASAAVLHRLPRRTSPVNAASP